VRERDQAVDLAAYGKFDARLELRIAQSLLRRQDLRNLLRVLLLEVGALASIAIFSLSPAVASASVSVSYFAA
jgi:hypothetical protein